MKTFVRSIINTATIIAISISCAFADNPLSTQIDFESAKSAYSANNGFDLVKSPKIRPDNLIYALKGKIHEADQDDSVFVAEILLWSDTAIIPVLNAYYAAIVIPKELSDYYFENARMNSDIEVIGTYSGNVEYQTGLGDNKIAPVIEAMYFRIR